MQDFDKLWNYNDPAKTESEFKKVLNESDGKPPEYQLQLQTQIARTYSLRGLFTEAHKVLDEVEKSLPPVNSVAQVRYQLERGRTFNSAGKKQEAKTHFTLAKALAGDLKADFYTVDAIHMLAIVSPPVEAIKLQLEGIVIAEQSADEAAGNWVGSLYNNLGWSYFDLGRYEEALSIFLLALQWRESKKSETGIFLAKWCVARTLRALNKTDEAIKIQLALFEEATNTGQPDGYVHEELGELFFIKNDQLKYPFHFEKAFELLSTDRQLQLHEPARLERIKRLAGL